VPTTVVRRAAETRLTIIALAALVLVLALILLPTQRAAAHPTGSTGVFLTVRQDAVDVKMQIQKAGFVAATGYDIATEQSELDAISDNLLSFLLNRVHISDEQGALGAGFRGEGLGSATHFDEASFTPERCDDAIRAGVAAVLTGMTGVVLWIS
jgi:hypothetical protein